MTETLENVRDALEIAKIFTEQALSQLEAYMKKQTERKQNESL